MKRDRRRRRPAFFEEAGLWLRDYGGAILVAIGSCVLLAWLFHLAVRLNPVPVPSGTVEEAQVLRFGLWEGEGTQRPLVIVRTGDGTVRQLIARRQAIRHCRKGSRILLLRKDETLFVDPRGCPAASDSP